MGYETDGKIEAEMFRHALINFGEFEVDDDGFLESKAVIGLFVAGGGEEKKEEKREEEGCQVNGIHLIDFFLYFSNPHTNTDANTVYTNVRKGCSTKITDGDCHHSSQLIIEQKIDYEIEMQLTTVYKIILSICFDFSSLTIQSSL